MNFMQIALWLHQNFGVVMLAAFLAIVVVAYWPGRRDEMQRNAMIPFQEDR